MTEPKKCDVLIVGAGPAGFSAAISAASEGLSVLMVDSGPVPGGQALQSTKISNYPGFPQGITGQDLIAACMQQAREFDAEILCPEKIIALRLNGGPRHTAITEDGSEISARSIILAPGLSYNRHAAQNIAAFLGRGVQYGAPTSDPKALGECSICIVGGANSAGQAAVHLAKNPGATIKLLIRKKLVDGMSDYLVRHIQACSNIQVVEGVEVVGVNGSRTLECVTLSRGKDGPKEDIKAHYLFIFIGASPKVQWLRDTPISFDGRGFIRTGHNLVEDHAWDVAKEGRNPLPFEARPGIFCVGDARATSIKRIAAGVGEGSASIPNIHQYLALTRE